MSGESDDSGEGSCHNSASLSRSWGLLARQVGRKHEAVPLAVLPDRTVERQQLVLVTSSHLWVCGSLYSRMAMTLEQEMVESRLERISAFCHRTLLRERRFRGERLRGEAFFSMAGWDTAGLGGAPPVVICWTADSSAAERVRCWSSA